MVIAVERIKCILSYDGTSFSGFQVQPNGRTVQQEIEQALQRMHKGEFTRITASGRTDAGVHAKGQVIHFDTSLNIPPMNWKKALNTLLPADILIMQVERVTDQFHARFDVVEKEYHYFILNQEDQDLFTRNYTYHYPYPLNMEWMNEACNYLQGEHDFTSFCAANTGVKGDKIRTIYHASCTQEDNTIRFVIKGNGFLYNMVRIIIGTLVEIGQGERPPSAIEEIVSKRNRSAAGKTAPAQGLFLWNVVYNNDKL